MSAASPPSTELPARFQPVRADERHEILDLLRGFALFGVLLSNLVVNVEVVGSAMAAGLVRSPPVIDAFSLAFDGLGDVLAHFLVRGKFISLFALLFGFGFAVQKRRAEERGMDFAPFYRRRLGWLFFFGGIHLVLVWWGDILTLYALGGFLLLAWHRASDHRLLVGGGAMFFVSMALVPSHGYILSSLWARFDPVAAEERSEAMAEVFAQASRAFATGDWLDVLPANLLFYGQMVTSGVLPLNFTLAVGLFLVGHWAGRRGLFLEAGRGASVETRERWRRWRRWGLVFGIFGHLGWLAFSGEHGGGFGGTPFVLLAGLASAFGVPGLVVVYVSTLALWLDSGRVPALLRSVARVGRMALTNYLAQSVLGVALLYGVGSGWGVHLGPALCWLLAVAIFGLQMLFCRGWLERYRFGPVEGVWRRLSYGRG